MEETADRYDLAMIESGPDAPVTDESLAVKAGDGDQFAFEELFIRYRYRIARIIGRFFHRPEKVEDIAQEVFTKTYFALGEYSPERGTSFGAWLSRIAINCCYDHLRHDRRRPEESLADITDEETFRLRARVSDDPASAEAALISRDLAAKLLARLKPEDRIVLALLDIDDMSVAEIVETTGWSASKVKVRAHRARVSLRRILAEFV